MSRTISAQAVRYCVVGAASVALDFAVFQTLIVLGLFAPVAAAISYLCGAVLHFTLNRYWSFRALHRPARIQLRGYLLVIGVAWCMTVFIVAAAVTHFHTSPQIARLIAIGATLPVGFLGHKYITYGNGVRSALHAFARIFRR